MTRKSPAPIPVIGASRDTSREDELRAWEEQQAQLRAQQAPQVPAPAAPLATPVDFETASVPAVGDSLGAAVGAASVEVSRRETPGYLPMPEFTEPESDDPLERLAHYSRGIMAAQYAARANHERAEQQKLIALGRRLAAIKKEELHRAAGFDTFGDLVESEFGFKKHQANNILRVLDVAIALEDLTTQELKERPLRVLAPVLASHGVEAVRKTWIEASRHGNITEGSLRDAANFLGYAPPKDVTPPKPVETGRKPPSASPLSGEYEAILLKIRSLAAQDQERARTEAQAFLDAARQLVEELSGEQPREASE